MRLGQSRYAPFLFAAIGLSYLLTFFTGHALGLISALYLAAKVHKRPSVYDLIPLFMIIDIFPIHLTSGFQIPLLPTMIFNLYFAKVFFFLFKESHPEPFSIIILALVICFSAWRGMGDLNTFSALTAFRDIKVLLAVTLAMGMLRFSPRLQVSYDRYSIPHIASFFVGVAISLTIYIVFFDNSVYYIILDSTKSLISISLIYSISHLNFLVISFILFINAVAFVFMSTRMNLLVISLLFLLLGVRRAPMLAIAATLVGVASLLWAADLSPQASRIASVTNIFSEPTIPSLGPVLSRFAEVDYIRAVEAHYTFQRGTVAELVLGRGLGAGFQDAEGYITAAFIDRHAFSLEEFRQGTFFGLHDPMIEWTFRYGLIVSITLYGGLFALLFKGLRRRDVLSIAIVLLVLTTYWSGKGVAMIALLGFIYQLSARPKNAT